MLERQERRRSSNARLLGWVLAIAILYFGREVFIPLALAALLAFLLAPVTKRLESRGLRRTPAVLLVTALLLSSLGVMCWLVLGQIYNLAVELPRYQENVTGKVASLHLQSAGQLTRTLQMLSAVSREVSAPDAPETPATVAPMPAAPVRNSRATTRTKSEAVKTPEATQSSAEPITVRVAEPESSIFGVASRNMMPLLHPLTTAFITVVFVVFMLLAQDDLRDRIIRLAGSSRMHVTTVAMRDASQRVSRYLLMQFVVNTGYGGVVGLALWGIGLPHPLLWAVLTAVLRFVPYVGIFAAGVGPLLVAIAVSPHWSTVVWTFAVFFVLEIVVANAVEPLLYGSSTGISALAILVAAIFWTWLWGLAGLLLSTPLTVCLIVLGRHFPPLEFIGVLFGEEDVLEPPHRIYQRLLANDSLGVERILEDLFAAKPREEVYDTALLPALALIEEARHTGELDAGTVDQMLESVEELTGDRNSRVATGVTPNTGSAGRPRHRILCCPARDLADELAGQMLLEIVGQRYEGSVLAAETTTAAILDAVREEQPDVVCVAGVPPQAARYVRLRCHQLRARYPELVIVACVLSVECDLPSIRGSIPIEDAQHVVCSVSQAREYLTALADPAEVVLQRAALHDGGEATTEIAHSVEDLRDLEVLDPSEDDVFNRIAASLAKSFAAPIAMVNPLNGERTFWRAQCGLPDEGDAETMTERDRSMCSKPLSDGHALIVPDLAGDETLAEDPWLKEMGIRFLAATPLRTQEGKQVGCLVVLDTRPREVTEQQEEILTSLANSVMNAIELRTAAKQTTG